MEQLPLTVEMEREKTSMDIHAANLLSYIDVDDNEDADTDYDYWYHRDVYDCYDPKSGEKVDDPLANCIKKNPFTLECCDEEGNCSGYSGPNPRDSYCFYSDGHQICA